MLYYTKETDRKLRAIGRQVERGKLDASQGARQMLALEPDFSPAILVTAEILRSAGDLSQAEQVLWNGLSRCPCDPALYYSLAGVIQRRRPEDEHVLELLVIAFRKVSLSQTISPLIAGLMSPAVGDRGPATNPKTYALMAETFGSAIDARRPPPVDDRLAPYRILDDLQFESSFGVGAESLREVLEHPAIYAPLLYGAIRESANTAEDASSLRPPALRIFTAILGEIGGPERIADLLELSQIDDEPTFLHVNWAIYRLGQRFPSAALETLRAAAKGAAAPMLCGLAEQLNLLPEMDGVLPALRSLLQEFPRIARQDNAPYLLAIVTDAMAERGAVDEAQSLLTRNVALLTKEGHKWLKESIDGDMVFVPRLVDEGIPNFSIQEMCIDRVYMDDEKDEDEKDEDEFENEEPAPGGDEPLPLRVLKGVARWHKKTDRTRAQEMFFGSSGDEPRDESEIDAYVQFLLYDFRDAATGRTLIEHFLDDHASRLSPEGARPG